MYRPTRMQTGRSDRAAPSPPIDQELRLTMNVGRPVMTVRHESSAANRRRSVLFQRVGRQPQGCEDHARTLEGSPQSNRIVDAIAQIIPMAATHPTSVPVARLRTRHQLRHLIPCLLRPRRIHYSCSVQPNPSSMGQRLCMFGASIYALTVLSIVVSTASTSSTEWSVETRQQLETCRA